MISRDPSFPNQPLPTFTCLHCDSLLRYDVRLCDDCQAVEDDKDDEYKEHLAENEDEENEE